MSDTNKYISVPPKELTSDLSSSGTTIKIADILDWNGETLTSAMFGTYIPATLINDARSKVEFVLLTASTIANATTTGITIYKRGLKYYAEGDSTDNDEVTANKLDWTAGETKLLLGTNAPKLYGEFANRNNDEEIGGQWTFDKDNRPDLSADEDTTTDEDLVTYGQLSRTAIAGTVPADETHAGLSSLATEAETLAGTDQSTIDATDYYLFVKPSQLAKNIQNAVYSYAADAEASDTYAITLSPAPSAYAAGQKFIFKANTANTGACTLNVNALGAKTIKKNADEDLEDGDIKAGAIVVVIYDGTNFQMMTQQSSMPTTALLEEMTTFFGSTDISGAEAETLTDGSDANDLHNHDSVFNFFQGVGEATTVKDYWTFSLPFSDDFWQPNSNTLTSYVSVMRTSPNGAITSNCITQDPIYVLTNGNAISFATTKKVIVEFGVSVYKASGNDLGFGLTEGTATYAFQHYDDQTDDACCFTVDSSGNLYAHTAAAGVGHTETAITGITLTNMNTYRIEFDPATDAKFYVNGVLKATITTNLPRGAHIYFGWGALTNTNYVKVVTQPYFAIEK